MVDTLRINNVIIALYIFNRLNAMHEKLDLPSYTLAKGGAKSWHCPV